LSYGFQLIKLDIPLIGELTVIRQIQTINAKS
jgi:hypothetical protein